MVYVMPGFSHYQDLMADLGKHRTGKSCLYLNRLDDVDQHRLRDLIGQSYALMHELYPCR